MGKVRYNIITLKPRWSVKDLFAKKSEKESRDSILSQLNSQYLSQGWTLEEEIMWDSKYRQAVVKLGPPPSS